MGMNVSLGKLGDWVKSQVEHGDFATDSEVIREALRRFKDAQEAESPELQAMVDQGLESEVAPFSEADWAALRHLAREGKPKGRK